MSAVTAMTAVHAVTAVQAVAAVTTVDAASHGCPTVLESRTVARRIGELTAMRDMAIVDPETMKKCAWSRGPKEVCDAFSCCLSAHLLCLGPLGSEVSGR